MNEFDNIRQIAEIKLKENKQLTDLEKDILDTLKKIEEQPFDYDGTIFQIRMNNANYPEAFAIELANPENKLVDLSTLPEHDLLQNLQIQLEHMLKKRILLIKKSEELSND